MAQHLLSELSVYDNYVIKQYPEISRDICPCDAYDELVGDIGDTRFGECFIIHPAHDIVGVY